MSTNFVSTLLTDKDLAAQLKAITRKIRRLYEPKRWTDAEAFERSFRDEKWQIDWSLTKLAEAFTFTQRVGWLQHKAARPAR